jgi:hypothetical protein
MKRIISAVVVAMLLAVPAAEAQEAQQDTERPSRFRGGVVRFGGFHAFGIDTTVAAKSQRFPLGIHIDMSKDLGISDSDTVPRVALTFRFNKRSQIDFDWYSINRSALKRLEREISIGPIDFPIGVQVAAFTDVSIYKGVYTWLFHDDPKVNLGLSAGLHVIDFAVGIDAGPDRIGDRDFSERAGVTAPLPVLGFRLIYRITPKFGLLFTSDALMVKFDKYSGTFQDTYAFAEYRISKRFGLGGGVNVLSLDVTVDDDERLGRIQHTLTGVVGYAAVYF